MRTALEQLIRQAGKIALEQTLTAHVHIKGQNDFVTDTDLAISRFLEEELTKLVPGSHVISEESDARPSMDGGVFIIDPIDGTTNLMYGLGLSAVSVGYLENGVPMLGIVYNPFHDEIFVAERGKGAWCNGSPIRVNNDETLADALIAYEAGPGTAGKQSALYAKICEISAKACGIRLTGSAALDLAYIASGRLSGCVFHYLYPWDYAAGALLLSETGGKLSKQNGDSVDFANKQGLLIASNGKLHQELVDTMRDVD